MSSGNFYGFPMIYCPIAPYSHLVPASQLLENSFNFWTGNYCNRMMEFEFLARNSHIERVQTFHTQQNASIQPMSSAFTPCLDNSPLRFKNSTEQNVISIEGVFKVNHRNNQSVESKPSFFTPRLVVERQSADRNQESPGKSPKQFLGETLERQNNETQKKSCGNFAKTQQNLRFIRKNVEANMVNKVYTFLKKVYKDQVPFFRKQLKTESYRVFGKMLDIVEKTKKSVIKRDLIKKLLEENEGLPGFNRICKQLNKKGKTVEQFLRSNRIIVGEYLRRFSHASVLTSKKMNPSLWAQHMAKIRELEQYFFRNGLQKTVAEEKVYQEAISEKENFVESGLFSHGMAAKHRSKALEERKTVVSCIKDMDIELGNKFD